MSTRLALYAAAALFAAACASQEIPFVGQDVPYRVRAPAHTPSDATVVVRGSHASFGDGVALTHAGDGGYVGSVALPPDASVTYSVALRLQDGAEASELDSTWGPVPERTLTVVPDAGVSVQVANWDYPSTAERAGVTFEVTAPAGAGSSLSITGNLPELGAWTPPGVSLLRRADGKYVGRAYLPVGASVQYLFTRGAWSTAEITASGAERELRTLTVGSAAQTVSDTVERFIPTDKTRILTGQVEYLRAVASAHVRSRDVIIWLPPGYSEAGNTARYPVLYMHDGQNVMDGATSFVGEWHVDEVAQRLVKLGLIEPVIIVGVYNVGSDRIADYTPVPDPAHGGGEAAAYARFLVDELKPQIDAAYRTKPDPASTGVAGSSLGGLVSLYLGLTEPETFGRLGVVSPSVWWSNREILSEVTALEAKLPLRIWVDIGTQEGSNPQQTVSDTRALRDALIEKGWSEWSEGWSQSDLRYLEAAGGGHNEVSWAARVDQMLRFLYPPL